MSNETMRTPADVREQAAADADEIWYHWIEGQEDLAIAALRKASDEELARFLDMLARWQKCPKPSDHDAPNGDLRTPRGEGEPVAYMVTASRYSGGGVEWVGDWLFRGPAECEEHVRWLHRPQSRWQDVRVTPLYAALRSEAQGEGWQVTEPARDIVRREMPETRATVREAIRAARRGEGGGE